MDPAPETPGPSTAATRDGLVLEWRRLGRAATVVALLTSPATFGLFAVVWDLPIWLSLILTIGFIAVFRGLVDVVCHKFIPRPSLYDADPQTAAEDVVYRRRRWYWRTKFRRFAWLVAIILVVHIVVNLLMRLFGTSVPLFETFPSSWTSSRAPVPSSSSRSR